MLMRKWGLVACGFSLALPCLALPTLSLGAAETALHKANTSVGVKNTAANQWKLETDPSVVTPDPTVGNYYISGGVLNNHYDPSQFALNTDVGTFTTGTFSVGGSVFTDPSNPYYQVTSFKVQTVEGGTIDVTDNGGGSTATADTSTGPVGGGYTGNVLDITFNIISGGEYYVPPANVDQNFYELNLTQIGSNPPGYDTTYTDPNSVIDVSPFPAYVGQPGYGSYSIPFQDINPSATPEVSSASLLAIGGFALLIGRRKAKTATAS
jgi:hypothetical protein